MAYKEGQYWKNDLMLSFLQKHNSTIIEVADVRLKEYGDSYGDAMEQFIVNYAALGSLTKYTCLVSVRAFQMFCRDEKPIIWT